MSEPLVKYELDELFIVTAQLQQLQADMALLLQLGRTDTSDFLKTMCNRYLSRGLQRVNLQNEDKYIRESIDGLSLEDAYINVSQLARTLWLLLSEGQKQTLGPGMGFHARDTRKQD